MSLLEVGVGLLDSGGGLIQSNFQARVMNDVYECSFSNSDRSPATLNPFAGLDVLRVVPQFFLGVADGGECDGSFAVSGQIRCTRYRFFSSDTSTTAKSPLSLHGAVPRPVPPQ